MIKVLLIESDPETRDIIQVGLDNFQVFEVDHASDTWGLELFRENDRVALREDENARAEAQRWCN